jgi:hypothetical protein
MGRHGGGNSDSNTPTDGRDPQGGKRGTGGDTNDNPSDGKRGQ